MSDEQLVAAAKADKTEFVRLYDKYFDQIYRFVLTRVADVQLAEDLTSDTFLIAIEKIGSYTWMGKPFSAWLYRVAINEINQHYKKSKHEFEASVAKWHDIGEKFEAPDHDIKEGEDAKESLANLKLLNESFHKLSEDDKDILSLKYFENLSYQEIADALELTVTNVGVKLNRATERLKKCVSPSGTAYDVTSVVVMCFAFAKLSLECIALGTLRFPALF
ncbi:MAG: ECF subfamily RNA polymerase sigma-24 subunit, RNA polymerase sigma-70 factor, ECF subfamily [Candidatus Peregrinibacteria bacterium GW2011_GWF2_43_17]|nr:MAG: ECF subfamily RNA polymerase sigma-24 subunit, RNA polymerase sigma-70 factor, ECF subfamily [Candidatus Peregrinibacteria bacterium GW2011_GWF2_43_17]KKT19572.1 MAG: RNA polymerase, sigma-24 subunit, ECF subfamily [Candidatus Peregrinibacteria bacterium GW2011_GWA2_43_8]HAU39983.1 hypothetical protein [Candidatus Peregrinibacteria bacterium]